MITYLFPGQGSQFRGMGAGLFDEFPQLTSQADKILGYSIKSLCLEDPKQQLFQTQYTQPALYVVNALSYLKKIKDTSQKPDYVVGHSLGEYNALFAADVFDFETGLQLVKKRGELMSQSTHGGMAAVLGLDIEKIQSILQENNFNSVSIANHNAYTQFVISGLKEEVEKTKPFIEKLNGNFILLRVSGAFHSNYMSEAQHQFSEFLKSYSFNTPSIPIIANIDAKPYHPAIISYNLSNHINHPVQWIKTIEYLLSKEDMEFVEVGPGTVLTGLINRIRKDIH